MANRLSESHGPSLPSRIPTILGSFHKIVANYPSTIALVSTHQSSELYGIPSDPLPDEEYQQKPYLRWNFQNFQRAIDRLASALRARGAGPGIPIITFLPNGAEYALTLMAAWELGAIMVPVNPRNLINAEEVVHMLRTVAVAASEKRPIVVTGSVEISQELDCLRGVNAASKIVVSNDTARDGWELFGNLMIQDTTNGSHATEAKETQPEPAAELILFTSGTTSLPKGVRQSSEKMNLLIHIRSIYKGHPEPGDKVCIVLPNNHAMNWINTMSPFYSGAAVVYPGPAFVPHSMMKTLQVEKCTHTMFVPTMVHALLGLGAPKLDLKVVFIGGSTSTPELIGQIIHRVGSQMVENAYGMTEGALIFPGGESEPKACGEISSVGKAVLGSHMKILEPESGKLVHRGTPGELHYSGGALSGCYIGKESDDYYKDAAGMLWFNTGDQAIMGDEDEVYIVGRYKGIVGPPAPTNSP